MSYHFHGVGSHPSVPGDLFATFDGGGSLPPPAPPAPGGVPASAFMPLPDVIPVPERGAERGKLALSEVTVTRRFMRYGGGVSRYGGVSAAPVDSPGPGGGERGGGGTPASPGGGFLPFLPPEITRGGDFDDRADRAARHRTPTTSSPPKDPIFGGGPKGKGARKRARADAEQALEDAARAEAAAGAGGGGLERYLNLETLRAVAPYAAGAALIYLVFRRR